MICPAQTKRTSKPEDLVTEILREATAKAVTVELVQSLEEETRWNKLIRKHHYLKEHRMVGESLRYVIKQDGEWIGLGARQDSSVTPPEGGNRCGRRGC